MRCDSGQRINRLATKTGKTILKAYKKYKNHYGKAKRDYQIMNSRTVSSDKHSFATPRPDNTTRF